MKPTPFNEYLGVELARRGDGEVEVYIDLKPHHVNRRGVAHGGVVTALLDSALGGAVITSMPESWWCATTSLSTQFVGGARGGRLSATGRIVHRGGRVAFATGEARDADGRTVATAQGTWHLWQRRPGSGPAPGTVRVDGRTFRVGKIVAVGRNYRAHAAEMRAPADAPVWFLKPRTALVAGDGSLTVPTSCGEVHHEVELVALIGKALRGGAAESALDHVAGYAVGLDLTLRDLQGEAKRRGEPWSESKSFDGSAPVSSFVSRDTVGDASGLAIELSVNGEPRQHGNTSQMTHGVAELLARVSRFMTLEPGDLLFTGTPAGVGPVSPGDRIEAQIERVGRLCIEVEAS